MNDQKYNCFLVMSTKKNLLRFSYSTSLGIYYQVFINGKWLDKKIIYKESFENFYVIEDFKGNINILCQDVCGDVILCTLDEKDWKYKTLLYMKHNETMPIKVKAFFSRDKIHLLYNFIDNNKDLEKIVYQPYEELNKWASAEDIIKVDCYSSLSYYISQSYKYSVILINTMSFGIYKLSSRVLDLSKNIWGKEIVIYISRLPYIDFSFCVVENRSHYLIITEENKLNVVIYQYKEILLDKEMELQKNIILFEEEKVDSCIIMTLDKVLWALWISNKKLYGCFSTNNGQDFSNPEVYKIFNNKMPTKVCYKEFTGEEENKYRDNEIYISNYKGEVHLFLDELLDAQVALDIDNINKLSTNFNDIDYKDRDINHKDIECNSKSLNYTNREVKDYCMELESFNIEKLQKKLKDQTEKIIKLDNEIKILNDNISKQKNQLSNLQYKFNKEKERLSISIKENNMLKEKNDYLENKLLLKDKEKVSIEERLLEKNKENESLRQEINERKFNNKDKNRGEKFSIKKWIFDNKE